MVTVTVSGGVMEVRIRKEGEVRPSDVPDEALRGATWSLTTSWGGR